MQLPRPHTPVTINNLEAFMASLPDWTFLAPLRPTDIDGLIERNGRLLMLEWKQPGTSVPRGQEILFDWLTRCGDTVFVIRGTNSVPETVEIWGSGGEVPASAADIQALAVDWRSWASSAPFPAPMQGWQSSAGAGA